MPESPAAPAQLFYSYSHKDERLRDQLKSHLAALTRENLISGWNDRMITAGTEWKGQIDDRLKEARIILLLVTARFLDSEYCNDVELRFAMERHHKGEARVIPVILKPCDWRHTVFAKLQALPKDGKAITKWSNRDEAWLNVVEGIRNALKEIGQGSTTISTLTGTTVTSASPLESPSAPSVSSQVISPPVINALHGLPAPPADFTGRDAELKELLAAVKTGGVTISGLQGLGGVGKTALALKLAEQLKPDYPDAQFYVDLKGVTQPLAPKEAMAHVIRAWDTKAQLPEKDEEITAVYRSVLNGKRALLLMDNARDAEQVASLIPPDGCLLLVTSRKHFTLPGLFEKNLDKLPPADARELLLRIAPRLKKEKADQVDELARLCGYLPLALRAVASALQEKKNINPADYVNRLKETGKHLVLKEIDPSLQKSVGAALQSSYDLLSDNLRQKLRFLAVFPDTFDLAATAAVWDVSPETSQDAMSELLAYSLVEFDEITERYNLHDLVRLFAGQRLNAEEQYNTQKHRAGHYLKILASAGKLYIKGGESVTQGLALFDLEVTNIRAGHDWVVAHQQDDDAVAEWCMQYPVAGRHCLSLRQHPRERIRWLERALTVARRLSRRDLEGAALGNLGIAYYDSGEFRRAIEYHEQHLQITREAGDRLGEGQALGNMGVAYHSLGEYRRAIEYHEQDLQVAREIDDRLGEGAALGNLGISYASLGEPRRAIGYYEQQLQITREIGDRVGEAHSLYNSALAIDNLGDRTAAIVPAEAALKIYEAIESPDASEVRDQLAKWRDEDKASG